MIYNSKEVETGDIQSLQKRNNLKLDLLSFNIFESSEYEKIVIF